MTASAPHARLRVAVVLATLLGVLAFACAHAHAAGLGVNQQAGYTETLLSNEADTSRWAFVTHRVIAWSAPENTGYKVRRLTTETPDHTSELVLALRERVYTDGSVWTEVRLPMLGHGRTGWVDRNALDRYRVVHTRIDIDRGSRTASLYDNQKLIWRAPIAIGRPSAPTPAGHFYVRDRLVTTDPHGIYGPDAIAFSAYSTKHSEWPGGRIVGIHGTNRPKLIPGHAAYSCIRITNPKMRKFFKYAAPGTPVSIH